MRSDEETFCMIQLLLFFFCLERFLAKDFVSELTIENFQIPRLK